VGQREWCLRWYVEVAGTGGARQLRGLVADRTRLVGQGFCSLTPKQLLDTFAGYVRICLVWRKSIGWRGRAPRRSSSCSSTDRHVVASRGSAADPLVARTGHLPRCARDR